MGGLGQLRWQVSKTFTSISSRSTYSKMPGLIAVVAAVGGCGTAKAESWAFSLDVAKALAVVALLCLCSTRHRALG
jgi:hypothetical protein